MNDLTNNPPSPIDVTLEDLVARANELMASAKNAPREIADSHTAAKFSDACRQMAVCLHKLDLERKARTAPLRRQMDEINRAWSVPHADLTVEMEILRDRLFSWMNATGIDQVRGDYGSLASVGERGLDIEIDLRALDIEGIVGFLDMDAIKAAALAAYNAGNVSIRGVRFVPRKQLTIR